MLSTDTLFGNVGDILLADVAHDGALAAGASYNANWTGQLPDNVSDFFYVLVKTDHGAGQAAVYEFDDVGSNVGQATDQVDLASAAFGDLVAAWNTAPDQAQVGQTINFSWTVTNTTDAWGTTPVSSWHDRIILSRDNIYGNGDDQTLIDHQRNGVLDLGASYTTSAAVLLPSNFNGDGFLLM